MEGQVRGLLSMIEDERDCIDILTQVASVRAALEGFGSLVLTEHVEEMMCTGNGAADPGARDRVERIREAIARLMR
jgi:DNA-binding FrmR family transcriptional regulator